jgi:glycosyltransferase involved in cell wall biosynthesis
MTGQPRYPDVGVVAFVPERWSPHWASRHHVISRLSQAFHVVWVNPPHDRGGILKRALDHRSQPVVTEVSPGLTVYTPEFWLPILYRDTPIAHRLAKLRVTRARRLLTARGCKRIVAYLWRPEFARVLDDAKWDAECYHIDDDYAFSDDEVSLDPAEVRLIQRVDEVFIHSPGLLARKGHLNPHTTYVPLGVDFRAFSTPVAEPPDLAAVPHPRIGYAGHLKMHLDWPLLRALAERHRDYSFVFVGGREPHPEIEPEIAALAQLPNVFFLGEKATRAVPGYVRHFDVGIMPYRMTPYANLGSPLKLHEYLAAGLPSIGIPMRTLLEFEDVVTLCSGLEAWSEAIVAAVAPEAKQEDRIEQRRARAKEYDWEILVGRIATRMIAALESNG